MDVEELRRRAMLLAAGQFSPMPAHGVTYLSKVPAGLGRLEWNVFGCLYPGRRYRLYAREDLTPFEARSVRDEILRIQLPNPRESLKMRPDTDRRYLTCAQFATTHDVPMGMYLTGRFFATRGGRPTRLGALWFCMELGETWTLELLQQVAREA